MKKTISITLILTVLLSLFTTGVFSADVTIYGLSEIGNVNVDYVNEVRYNNGGSDKIIAAEYISDDEADYLTGIFSDSGLVCTNSEDYREIEPSEYPQCGSFSYTSTDNLGYHFDFDSKKVLVRVADADDMALYQGWFAFKNSNTYGELMDFLNELYEQSKTNSEASAYKNSVQISNFKILYKFKTSEVKVGSEDFVWGVCSYKRNGKTVTAIYHAFIDIDELQLYTITEKLPDSTNTVSFDYKRLVQLENGSSSGIEYDNNTTWLYNYKIQANVTAGGKTQIAVITQNTVQSGNSETVMVKNYTESGSIPSSLFKVQNNVEYEKPIKDFKKLHYVQFEPFILEHDFENVEWGVCTYKNSEDETIKAFYFYLPKEDTYLLSPTKKLSAKNKNVINFSNYAIENGKETFLYNKYNFSVSFHVYDPAETGSLVVEDADGKYSLMVAYNAFGSIKDAGIELTDVDMTEEKAEESKETETAEKQPEETKTEQEKEVTEETETKTEEKQQEEVTEETEKTEETQQEETVTDETKTEATETELNDNAEAATMFLDVPATHWAYNEVTAFAEQEIVLGYGNGYFGVNDSITYEHFGLLLDRLFDYNAVNTEKTPAIREDVIVSVVKALGMDVTTADETIIEKTFSDCTGIKAENKKYIAAAIETGLVIGSDGKLFPADNLTRAETVVLLSRAI